MINHIYSGLTLTRVPMSEEEEGVTWPHHTYSNLTLTRVPMSEVEEEVTWPHHLTYRMIYPVLVILGVMVTTASVLVLRRPALRSLQVNRYFELLVWCDLVLCLTHLPVMITINGCHFTHYWLAWYFAHFGWTLISGLHSFIAMTLAWLALDRCLAVWWHLAYSSLQRPRVQLLRILGTAVILVGVEIPYALNGRIYCKTGSQGEKLRDDVDCNPGELIVVRGHQQNYNELWHEKFRWFFSLPIICVPGILLAIFNLSLVVGVWLGRVRHHTNTRSTSYTTHRFTLMEIGGIRRTALSVINKEQNRAIAEIKGDWASSALTHNGRKRNGVFIDKEEQMELAGIKEKQQGCVREISDDSGETQINNKNKRKQDITETNAVQQRGNTRDIKRDHLKISAEHRMEHQGQGTVTTIRNIHLEASSEKGKELQGAVKEINNEQLGDLTYKAKEHLQVLPETQEQQKTNTKITSSQSRAQNEKQQQATPIELRVEKQADMVELKLQTKLKKERKVNISGTGEKQPNKLQVVELRKHKQESPSRTWERNLVITMIAMATSYLTLTTPMIVYLTTYAERDTEHCFKITPTETLRHVANCFLLLEHVIHPGFLACLNPAFRRELFLILRITR